MRNLVCVPIPAPFGCRVRALLVTAATDAPSPFAKAPRQLIAPKCRLSAQNVRGSLQLPRHTHTVPEHGKGEMPKRGNPSWVLFGSFSQRERTINKSSLLHQSSRQSPHLQHQRCSSAEIPPLRRRPKGFPIALWKPSAPSGWRKNNQQHKHVSSEQRQLPYHQHHRCSSAGIPPLRRRPKGFPVALWKPSGPSGWSAWCSFSQRKNKRQLPTCRTRFPNRHTPSIPNSSFRIPNSKKPARRQAVLRSLAGDDRNNLFKVLIHGQAVDGIIRVALLFERGDELGRKVDGNGRIGKAHGAQVR